MFPHANREPRSASSRARLRRSLHALVAALLVGLAILAASKAWAAGHGMPATPAAHMDAADLAGEAPRASGD